MSEFPPMASTIRWLSGTVPPRSSLVEAPAQQLRHIIDARAEDHRRDDERLVARLAVGVEARALEHAAADLAGRAAHAGDVGRQAVHVQRVPVARALHQRFGALPVLEAGVGRERVALEIGELRTLAAPAEPPAS